MNREIWGKERAIARALKWMIIANDFGKTAEGREQAVMMAEAWMEMAKLFEGGTYKVVTLGGAEDPEVSVRLHHHRTPTPLENPQKKCSTST